MFTVYLASNNRNIKILREDQCEWKLLPHFPIVKLDYLLPNKKTLRMQGFEEYLCLKEIYKLFLGASGQVLDTINILGKHNGDVYQFSMNVRKGKAFQRKGKDFAPLIIKPIKRLNPKEPKKFDIIFSKERPTNPKLWHKGIRQPNKATVQLI